MSLIPCIIVQDNKNEKQMRVYLVMIQSYCFLHSLRSFAKTNSVKKQQKVL